MSNDGCSSTCMVEDGYNCSGTPSSCSRVNRGLSLISATALSVRAFTEVETDQLFQFSTEA